MPDYVPALKARMGDWSYYVTVMKLGKIARECMLADEIHTNKDLDALIQRSIQDRVSKEMVPYLTNESQRFYGALVVAVYGGDPEFSPVNVAEHELIDDKEKSSYGFGLLRFDGSQIYYALDGQHRLKSIQEAIKITPSLATEEISVIILKHENSQEDLQRTRRLFSTLNRRAKPTSSGMNIAIDEDDAIAITSRRLVKENEKLKSLVLSTLGGKQLSPAKTNDPYITTLTAFYEANELLLSAYDGGLTVDKNFKQFRPSEDDLDNYYSFLEEIWEKLILSCPDFKVVLAGKKQPRDIRKLVDSKGLQELDESGKSIAGGCVFARPIGQSIIAEVLKQSGISGKSILETIEAIMSNISMDINQAPWINLIWNPTTHRIIGGKSEHAIISHMISHALGLRIPMKVKELKSKYRDYVGNPRAQLIPTIEWNGKNIHSVEEEDDE